MDGRTLMAAMSYPGYPAPLPLDRYAALAPRWDQAMRRAGCITVKRVAMAAAQLGAESGSLRWTEELADGSAYEGRLDLGNTQRGDGHRFKGRSFIQITGRTHYTNLSRWAHDHGYVPTATFFVDQPGLLAEDLYVFLGFVWYWTVARPQLNSLADASDIDGATRAVNGGLNNIAGRTTRWRKCLTLGSALLPAGAAPADSSHHQLPGRKAPSSMYELIYNVDTKLWYMWAPGYWRRITSSDELRWAANSALCRNGAYVLAELNKPVKKRTYPHIGINNAHTILRKTLALGSA